MAADIIHLASERTRRRPDRKPVPQPTPPTDLPELCSLENVTELFRRLEAQIG
jgi:hypothetical protein